MKNKWPHFIFPYPNDICLWILSYKSTFLYRLSYPCLFQQKIYKLPHKAKNQNGYTYSCRYTYNWKKHLKNHLTIHSIWNCVIHCISPWLSFDTSFYHISVFLSKIFHFQNYIFYIILHLLVVFLLKYDILFLTSCITEFLTHVYYTYYNIIIERGGILCQWNQKKW